MNALGLRDSASVLITALQFLEAIKMRILELEPKPITELTFLNAGRGPGQYYEDILPVELAWVDQLPTA